MEAVAIKRVNRRLSTPSVNSMKGAPYEVGDVVEFDKLVKGDRPGDSEVWLRKSDNSYVWSGGTNVRLGSPYYKEDARLITAAQALAFLEAAPNAVWAKYGIADIWKKHHTLGAGVKIAIVDTGIGLSGAFNHDLVSGWNYAAGNNLYHDADGHGTSVAGIIGAATRGLVGIAPNATLFVAKFADTDFGDALQLANCLTSLAGTDIDIISISHSFGPFKDNTGRVRDAIRLLGDKLIVCSCGNDGAANVIDKVPCAMSGELPNVLSVAACDQHEVVLESSTRSGAISLTAPGQDLATVAPDGTGKTFSLTSAATPFVSGVLALMLSAFAGRRSKADIRNALLQTCLAQPQTDRYGKGIIRPLDAINSL